MDERFELLVGQIRYFLQISEEGAQLVLQEQRKYIERFLDDCSCKILVASFEYGSKFTDNIVPSPLHISNTWKDRKTHSFSSCSHIVFVKTSSCVLDVESLFSSVVTMTLPKVDHPAKVFKAVLDGVFAPYLNLSTDESNVASSFLNKCDDLFGEFNTLCSRGSKSNCLTSNSRNLSDMSGIYDIDDELQYWRQINGVSEKDKHVIIEGLCRVSSVLNAGNATEVNNRLQIEVQIDLDLSIISVFDKFESSCGVGGVVEGALQQVYQVNSNKEIPLYSPKVKILIFLIALEQIPDLLFYKILFSA